MDSITLGSSLLVSLDEVVDQLSSIRDSIIAGEDSDLSVLDSYYADKGLLLRSPGFFIDGDVFYSYVSRRVRFLDYLVSNASSLNNFYVQVQNDPIKDYVAPLFRDDLGVRVYRFSKLVPPLDINNLKNLLSPGSRVYDRVVFSVDDPSFFSDDSLPYHVFWSLDPGSGNVSLAIRRLKPVFYADHFSELYFHAIFDSGFRYLLHSDSHVFRYEEDDFFRRLNGSLKVPLKVRRDGSRSKFYHFYFDGSSNPLDSVVGFDLVRSFFDDPRIDYYFENL